MLSVNDAISSNSAQCADTFSTGSPMQLSVDSVNEQPITTLLLPPATFTGGAMAGGVAAGLVGVANAVIGHNSTQFVGTFGPSSSVRLSVANLNLQAEEYLLMPAVFLGGLVACLLAAGIIDTVTRNDGSVQCSTPTPATTALLDCGVDSSCCQIEESTVNPYRGVNREQTAGDRVPNHSFTRELEFLEVAVRKTHLQARAIQRHGRALYHRWRCERRQSPPQPGSLRHEVWGDRYGLSSIQLFAPGLGSFRVPFDPNLPASDLARRIWATLPPGVRENGGRIRVRISCAACLSRCAVYLHHLL